MTTTTTTALDNFCRGFLLNDPDYRHLYDILDDYAETFLQIELDFHDKETFKEVFPTICFTVIQIMQNNTTRRRAYLLAILGFAKHVHRKCKNLDWYDIDTMLSALVDILISVNFIPSNFCKNYFCSIL